MGNPFFTFFNMDQKAKKNKELYLYKTLSENYFWIQFSTLGRAPAGKLMKTRNLTFMHFPVGALPEVQNFFGKSRVQANFFNKYCI